MYVHTNVKKKKEKILYNLPSQNAQYFFSSIGMVYRVRVHMYIPSKDLFVKEKGS